MLIHRSGNGSACLLAKAASQHQWVVTESGEPPDEKVDVIDPLREYETRAAGFECCMDVVADLVVPLVILNEGT
jgi:hypothetical protein